MKNTNELIFSISQIHSKMQGIIDGQLSYHGLSFSEYLVIHHLSNAPSQCMRRIDLASKVGLTASGITRMLNPMEKSGIVQKETNSRDARVSLVKLTTAGKRLYKETTPGLEQASEILFKHLSEKQRNQLAEIFDKLI